MWNALLPFGIAEVEARPAPERTPRQASALATWVQEAAATAAAGLLVIAVGAALVLYDRSFFWRDDYQSYQLAGFRDIARSWSEGEFPLLSPYSWNSGALAGEYQNGVFSVFLTAGVLTVFGLGLPLPLAAAVLSILHLAILAAGAFRLSRWRGLPMDLAYFVALIASLNGWIVIWGAMSWFPALASFAWLPWLWWALDRALDRPCSAARAVPAGLFLYLVVTAGWPFTVLMAGMLSLWFSLRVRAGQGCWKPAWPVAFAWVVGLGLSAPAWLMLMEYTRHTARGQVPSLAIDPCWVIEWSSLPGLVFPALAMPWNVFGTVKLHRCAELAGGLVPLAAVLAVVCHSGRSFGRRYRWEFALCLLTLTLTLLPSLGNFRWSFRWLPFFFLIAGLLAAHALAELRSPPRSNVGTAFRPNPGRWATFLILLAWSQALLLGTDPTGQTLWQGAAFLAVSLAWTVVEWRQDLSPALRPWAPSLVVLATAGLTYVPIDSSLEVPSWELEHVAKQPPFDAAVTYLSAYTKSDISEYHPARPLQSSIGAGSELLPGNVSFYAGLKLINGYSPMKPLGLAQVIGFGTHGYLGHDTVLLHTPAADAAGTRVGQRLLARESGRGGLLEQMGVDGVIVSDRLADEASALEAAGWCRVGQVAGGQIFHRKERSAQKVRAVEFVTRTGDRGTAAQLVRERPHAFAPWILLAPGAGREPEPVAFAPAQVSVQSESRSTVVVEVTNRSPDRDSLVVFSRPWYPGYRAEFEGQPIAVELVNLIQPAVRLPAGASGRVTLVYRPGSLVLGCCLAAATGLAVLIVLALTLCRRRGRDYCS